MPGSTKYRSVIIKKLSESGLGHKNTQVKQDMFGNLTLKRVLFFVPFLQGVIRKVWAECVDPGKIFW